MTLNVIILIIVGVISTVATYITNHRFRLGAVKSSAFLSLGVALIFYVFPNMVSEVLTKEIPLVFFGASFSGMVSKHVFPKLWQVALSGVLFSLIYYNTSFFFTGYGGALGTTACIAVVLVFGLKTLLKGLKNKALW